jgi:replicative DNA helicase
MSTDRPPATPAASAADEVDPSLTCELFKTERDERLVVAYVWERGEVVGTFPFIDSGPKRTQTARNIAHACGRKATTVVACLDQAVEETRAQMARAASLSLDDDSFTGAVLESAQFDHTKYARQWLVPQLLLEGESAIIGGPKKTLKTTLLIDLAVSLATGSPFLGSFDVPQPYSVALFSGESGPGTLQETARRVCASKGLKLAECENLLWGPRLPSLSDDKDLEKLAEFLKEKKVQVVILDPLYLCLTARGSTLSATNLFDMGPRLLRVAKTCLAEGATPVFAHHIGKSAGARRARHGDPAELDDLAYAGVAEFARQWLLVSRREEYEPGTGHHELWLKCGGSAGHGGLYEIDVEEGRLDLHLGGRVWDVTVRPATASRKGAGQEAKKHEREQATRAKVLEFLAHRPGGETASQIIADTGCPKQLVRDLLPVMAGEGLVERVSLSKQAGRGTTNHDGWKLVAGVASTAAPADTAVPTPPVAPQADDAQADAGVTGANVPGGGAVVSFLDDPLPDEAGAEDEQRPGDLVMHGEEGLTLELAAGPGANGPRPDVARRGGIVLERPRDATATGAPAHSPSAARPNARTRQGMAPRQGSDQSRPASGGSTADADEARR